MLEKDDSVNNLVKIENASKFTQEKLEKLRTKLADVLSESDFKDEITIITTGSYGREEASAESDLDLFILFDADEVVEHAIPDELAKITRVITEDVPSDVGDTGTFGTDKVIKFSEMLQNIGGQNDDNMKLTRRMLFLLEGTWLYGEKRFNTYQKRLLEKYIKEDSPNGYLSKFFLNDIIRFYRTMATDFEYKVHEGNKEWGLRSTKLRFSRKLLYFSGIIVVAEVAELSQSKKIEKSKELLQLPVLKRVREISTEKAESEKILSIYEEFLESISDPDIRQKLQATRKDERSESEEYIKLRDLSREFSHALANWLKSRYSQEHEIHHSLLF